MRNNENDDMIEMSSRNFEDLIRNKKNLLSVFTLKGKITQVIIYLLLNFSQWNFCVAHLKAKSDYLSSTRLKSWTTFPGTRKSIFRQYGNRSKKTSKLNSTFQIAFSDKRSLQIEHFCLR